MCVASATHFFCMFMYLSKFFKRKKTAMKKLFVTIIIFALAVSVLSSCVIIEEPGDVETIFVIGETSFPVDMVLVVGQWTTLKEATCTEEGLEVRCGDDGNVETRNLPVLNHDYVNDGDIEK